MNDAPARSTAAREPPPSALTMTCLLFPGLALLGRYRDQANRVSVLTQQTVHGSHPEDRRQPPLTTPRRSSLVLSPQTRDSWRAPAQARARAPIPGASR